MLKDALYSRSQSQSGLTSLIGTRFYNVHAPQQTATPYVTFQIVSAGRVNVMGRDSLARPRVQMDSWGATRQDAENVNAQVVAAFSRWSGTVSSVKVKDTICLSDGIDIEADDVTLIPRITSEFEVTYEL